MNHFSALGGTAFLVIAGIIWLGGHPTAARAAQPANEKPAPKARFYLTETGPIRSFKQPADPHRFGREKPVDIPVQASRDVYPSGETLYYVTISFGKVYDRKLAADDVAALIKLDKQLKGKKKSEAKEVTAAIVHWRCIIHEDGEKVSYQSLYHPLDEAIWYGRDRAKLGPDFIPTLEQALKDVEALKAVKPSVSW